MTRDEFDGLLLKAAEWLRSNPTATEASFDEQFPLFGHGCQPQHTATAHSLDSSNTRRTLTRPTTHSSLLCGAVHRKGEAAGVGAAEDGAAGEAGEAGAAGADGNTTAQRTQAQPTIQLPPPERSRTAAHTRLRLVCAVS